MPLTETTSDLGTCASMPIEANTVATPDGTTGIDRPHAAASRAYSANARTSRSSATRMKRSGGANQTTPTAMRMRAAPLTTRVTPCPPSPPFPPRFSLGAERDRRRLDAAVAAIALLVGDDGLE